MLKAIIFDFDGVIADTEPIHFETFRKVLAEEGVVLTKVAYIEKYLPLDDKGCFSAVLEDNGRKTDEGLVADMIRRKSVYFDKFIKEHLIIFPGVVDFVKKAAKKYPLAIASGALRHEIEFGLQHAGIRREFQVIVSAEDVLKGKPEPEAFLTALKALNRKFSTPFKIKPCECLVIEDSLHGVASAHAAGMKCLAVTNSYSEAKLSAADLIVNSLEGYKLEDLERRFD